MAPFVSLKQFFHTHPKMARDYLYSIRFFEDIVGKDIETYFRELLEKEKEALKKGMDFSAVQQFIDDMNKYATWLKSQNVRRHGKEMVGQKLTQNTIKTRLAAIRSYASQNGVIMTKTHYANLFDVSKKGRLIDDSLEDKAFTIEEAREVHKRMTVPMQALFLTLISSGMRINEALGVRLKYTENGREKSDIDFSKNPVRIYIPAENTKTDTARTVFISRECADFLREHWIPKIPQYSEMRITRGKKLIHAEAHDPEKYVGLLFPFSQANFRTSLMRACGGAGLNHNSVNGRNEYHVHSIRKTTRTLLGAKRFHDLGEYLLGHVTGMDGSYVRLTVDKAAPIYLEAEQYLTLGDTLKKIEEVKDAKIAALEERIETLTRLIHTKFP